jgi:SDR family mycofactocin-dependent oxidoreductase
MGQFDGKVVFITGAARGQGRAQAVGFAREGARIIAIDIDEQVGSVNYPTAEKSDLLETARLVEELGGEIDVSIADVRDLEAMTAAVQRGVERFGRLDYVIANAGVNSFGQLIEMDEEQFDTVIEINLTGVWKTVRASAAHIIAGGQGGCILITSSTCGHAAMGNIGHYVTAKHGLTGLTKQLANELGRNNIRVNAVLPSNTRTVMGVDNDDIIKVFRPDLDAPTLADCVDAYASVHVIPDVPWMQPQDITKVMIFLCSDDAKYMTGAQIPVDVGMLVKHN